MFIKIGSRKKKEEAVGVCVKKEIVKDLVEKLMKQST
jgi:hypothetical protein